MSLLRNMLIGLAAGLFFVLLYAADMLGPLEERVYDFFLWGRPHREQIDNVVFLDVDDLAVAYNGVFPWPRSVMADGFLRLKEYGVATAVLDIEFIDKGPQGIDAVYFNREFPADFERTFHDVGANVSDLLTALRSGRISREESEQYEGELLALIQEEGTDLFRRTSAIARDNDVYLAQASALFGHTWVTLNLQEQSLSGEQAERRVLAEERFSYPVEAVPGIGGGGYIDVLPPIPSFLRSARGAGFTNVLIDEDGKRRRIFLAQKVYDHWYLQLAFAPLMEYLGHPSIFLEKERLIIKDAEIPSGGDTLIRDIVIPLDGEGRMMLDWPKTDYQDSFTHISFSEFSHLEDLESRMEQYITGLADAAFPFFIRFDESLSPAPGIIYRIGSLFDDARKERALALDETSDEAFSRYLEFRSTGTALIESLLALEPGAKIRTMAEGLAQLYPEDAEAIREEAGYIVMVADYLAASLEQYRVLQGSLRERLEGKFCVIGRTDTGTTDIGVNPFYGKYVNVGTHGVVLDTILRESFITPLPRLWSVVFCFVLSFLLLLVLGGLKPVPRIIWGIGGVAFFGVTCFVVFRYIGVFIGPLGPIFSAAVAVIVREMISYLISEKEKQFINKALSTYVSKEVVAELVANPSLLQLGGSKRQMTAVFTDIQSFSTISEQLDPEHLVQLLNRYLTVMSDTIMENMGTIDKYEGDAIVAFFGAPVYRKDHAAMACRSALGMKKAEVELNRQLIEQSLITPQVLTTLIDLGVKIDADSPVPLYTRIGINTGEMVVGNMGTSNKMNYTIMGNAVNLAARLEGVNKQYNTGGITISEYTKNEIGDEFIYRSLGRVRVVGINTPVRIYELLALRDEAGSGELDMIPRWEKAVGLYERREFQEAGEIFNAVAAQNKKDGLARFYMDLCRDYIDMPPPAGWDGVNNLSQ
ncbi:MAG: CHASE2 domain-containing protein, partial [Treponema sp.]|nr:CHASE2 domain-containing protein [Treponema sp.]